MNCFVAGEHFVEVRNVQNILGKLWLEFWGQLLAQELIYADRTEPRMGNDFFKAAIGSEPFLWVFGKTFADEVFAFVGHGDTMLFGVWEKHGL